MAKIGRRNLWQKMATENGSQKMAAEKGSQKMAAEKGSRNWLQKMAENGGKYGGQIWQHKMAAKNCGKNFV